MNEGSKKTIKLLCFSVLGMFTFSFALVPLYDVFCEVTGLNGKIELEATTNQNLETEIGRDVSIQFVSHNNEQMPWIFRPSESQIKIQTGKYHTATFYVKNPTNKRMIAQAIPSVAPSNAASHLKKLECFCFEEQELAPGEEALLPVRLIFDDELPDSIKSVVLSYTIFDVTDYNDLEMAAHHDGHEMEASL
ncbi:cytochrome c oxidase assembly protein [Gammaproteobacteria bacterium]|nr:cytochrome c oxidase assembly protein [Gammaproteobacteria bacterium]MDB3877338.1 cytochrome c oxidase assembly protein [Gammaproteobacteria bacterium]MDC0090650.1 cytochrome c oxidase assembly protein [Gammaproteobacteria bacterium]